MSSARVRAFVDGLPRDAIFARKQLVGEFGSRGVVDNVLKRLCSEDKIARVAAGIYQKRMGASRLPSAAEIIELRASVFGKTVIRPTEASTDSSTFLTDGCRSSFRSIHGRLYFKPISRARLRQPVPKSDSRSSNRVIAFPPCQQKSQENKLLSLLRRWFLRVSAGWG